MFSLAKKSVCILLILTMLFSAFALNSSAAMVDNEDEIMPCYTTISSIATGFSISGLNSTATVTLSAKVSTSLYIKIEFQKLESTGYTTLKTIENSGTGYNLSLSGSRLINIFEDYRIKVTCRAGSETDIIYDYPD